jgi:hypothetical protein
MAGPDWLDALYLSRHPGSSLGIQAFSVHSEHGDLCRSVAWASQFDSSHFPSYASFVALPGDI